MAFFILIALIAAGCVVYYTIKQTENRKPSEPVVTVPTVAPSEPVAVTPEEQAALEQTAQGTQSSSGPIS